MNIPSNSILNKICTVIKELLISQSIRINSRKNNFEQRIINITYCDNHEDLFWFKYF